MTVFVSHDRKLRSKRPNLKSYAAALRSKADLDVQRLEGHKSNSPNTKSYAASLRSKAGFKLTWPKAETKAAKP